MSTQLIFLGHCVDESERHLLEEKREMAGRVIDELLVLKKEGISKRFVDFIAETASKLSADAKDVQDLLWCLVEEDEIRIAGPDLLIEVRCHPAVPEIIVLCKSNPWGRPSRILKGFVYTGMPCRSFAG